jgi:RNA polymerase sigma-70 factor, ECF subfamily
MREEAAPSRSDDAGAAGSGLGRLVERIQAGDRAAETELVERFSRGLILLLRRLAQNPALADDLHQETLALVIQKIRRGEVREPESLAGFLRSTARNLFLADRRKAARYGPLATDEAGGGPGATLADRGPAPVERVMAEEEAREVRRLLGELRFERDRQLLFRFYLSDDSRERICADLEIDPERFNQVLHRARERLRELWERAEKRRRFLTGARGILGRSRGLLALLIG